MNFIFLFELEASVINIYLMLLILQKFVNRMFEVECI